MNFLLTQEHVKLTVANAAIARGRQAGTQLGP